VRVKRPGLSVRSRTGFFGRPDSSTSAIPETPQAQILQALVSPFASEDLPINLTALFSPSGTESSIRILLHFDPSQLSFAENPDGSRTAELDIVAATFDADGQHVDTLGKTSQLRVTPQVFENVRRSGIVFSDSLLVKKPGPYQLRVVVRDTGSRRLGSAMQFIDVPDTNKGRLTLSGIVMARGKSSDAGAPAADGETAETPALRIFKPGSMIAYAFKVLNARTDVDKMLQLKAQVRLFREGRQVFATPSNPVEAEGRTTSKSLAVTGQLQLPQIPAGDYILQIIVTDDLRDDKYRIAVQTIDFQIQD
jgi:hypothetical protein